MKGNPLLPDPGRWLVAVALLALVGLGARWWLARSASAQTTAPHASQRTRAAPGQRNAVDAPRLAEPQPAERVRPKQPRLLQQEPDPALYTRDAGAPPPERTTEPAPETEPTPETEPAPAPESNPDPLPSAPVAPPPRSEPPTRQIQLTSLADWSQPGLCAESSEAAAARQTLNTQFRAWGDAVRGIFHVDPRLTPDASLTILQYVEDAERDISTQLRLQAPRPEVFVYFDTTLMQAAACINADVAAYYDGAMHVVANRSDTRSSTIHEYTHHALMSSGLVGPAWAQEGIAMLIAEEGWWLDRERLEHLALRPFSLDVMEQTIPYRLPAEQAEAFYAQSAATVACVLSENGWSLRELVNSLRAGADPARDALVYERPKLDSAAAWRKCSERLLREPHRWGGR